LYWMTAVNARVKITSSICNSSALAGIPTERGTAYPSMPDNALKRLPGILRAIRMFHERPRNVSASYYDEE
jgi:hypothetical protein